MSKVVRVSLIAAIALVVAGCGSTRFVVVDNGGGGTQGQSTATTSAPADDAAGTAGATASAGTPQPATAAETKQLEAAIKQALTIDGRSFAERQKALDGSDDLGPTFAAVVKIAKDLGVKTTIDSATVAGDTATAVVTVIVSGDPFASGVPVPFVNKDGKWLVTRDGASAVLALGSPCPEVAPS